GGKTVVLDEVHAYDTYTSTLILQLVAWLGAMGASVILLSATLPRRRRADLVRAFGASSLPSTIADYPRITWVSEGRSDEVPTGCQRKDVMIQIEPSGSDPAAVARVLAALLDEGGCAAWICNTVDRSQRIYRELRTLRDQDKLAADTDLRLLHARFPYEDRQA